MQLHHLELASTGRFSPLFLDYIQQKKELNDFYGVFPELGNFRQIINQRSFSDKNRSVLVSALLRQYSEIETGGAVGTNIDLLLSPDTFTVTTGHQLNLCTGPLYFIYKVITAINMAKALKTQYPEYNFVPVYWMASEDHDFDEINHFRLFGKKHVWQTEQTGPVGRINPQALVSLFDEIPELPAFIRTAYLQSGNLADAMRRLVHHLFSAYGLVIIDGDDAVLKKLFCPVMSDELVNRSAFRLAGTTTQKLESLGYKGQVFPREINLFFMENGLRERIEMTDEGFTVLNTDKTFDRDTIKRLVAESPEKCSPNVILRPLYQETILPNLAYIGGPAEVAYWLQLKPVFDHYHIPFPAVVPRSFAMIIPKGIAKKMEKVGAEALDLFSPFHVLKDKIIQRDSNADYELADELDTLKNLFESIKQKAVAIDPTLEGAVMSEYKNTEKNVGNLARRIKRAEEQRHEIAIGQLQAILDKLFPDGNLQEREDNFLNFYLNNPHFIDELALTLDPFDFRLHVLKEDV